MIFSLIAVCLVYGSAAHAQTLTANKILQNVKANFDAVKDYTATLKGTVNMERLRVPPMNVKVYFKQPNKFKTESKGTTFIPKNILDINPGDLLEKFDASLLGKEVIDGKTFYKIRLVTKAARGKQVRESFIWVEEGRWTITRLEAYPSEGRKIEILITSILVEGKYILPERITARFDFEQSPDSTAERIYSPQRIPKKGSAELIYSDYQVNTGLSDDLFEQPVKPKE
jgi:outer membrane lipoprotein-sorting protein